VSDLPGYDRDAWLIPLSGLSGREAFARCPKDLAHPDMPVLPDLKIVSGLPGIHRFVIVLSVNRESLSVKASGPNG
jgi:hypothetical protein